MNRVEYLPPGRALMRWQVFDDVGLYHVRQNDREYGFREESEEVERNRFHDSEEETFHNR